jgi:hypothetical protein
MVVSCQDVCREISNDLDGEGTPTCTLPSKSIFAAVSNAARYPTALEV